MKITQRSVNALPKTDKRYFKWCEQLSGFGVRVNLDGSKTYIVKYRVNGRQVKASIGKVEAVKAEEARRRARRIIADASDGIDRIGERKAKENQATIHDLAARFKKEYVPHHVRASTAADYARSIDKFIVPKLGRVAVANLTRADIHKFHQDLAPTPYQANRVLGTLSVMMSQAEIWGLRPEGINPCLKVKRFKEHKRERYLSTEELSRLATALQIEAATAPVTAYGFWLLILTGCRLGEIQKLRWDQVSFERMELVFGEEESKTGRKTVVLNASALSILKTIPRLPDNPYVIHGRIEGQYLTDFQKPWRRIRKQAGLEDVRIHDLRHTFASYAAGQNNSLHIIGKLLGHTQAQTTARYAHLANDPIRKASDEVGLELAEIMGLPALQTKIAAE